MFERIGIYLDDSRYNTFYYFNYKLLISHFKYSMRVNLYLNYKDKISMEVIKSNPITLVKIIFHFKIPPKSTLKKILL